MRVLTDRPGVDREEANGHTGYAVAGRRFAWLQVDHHGDGRLALVVKAPPGEQEALLGTAPCYSRPGHLGARGWLGVDLSPAAGADWDEVAALLDQAWRTTAPERLTAGS
nr:MmcQ/YjbR family DNA-binding protein [Geodermatophilus sabuli]